METSSSGNSVYILSVVRDGFCINLTASWTIGRDAIKEKIRWQIIYCYQNSHSSWKESGCNPIIQKIGKSDGGLYIDYIEIVLEINMRLVVKGQYICRDLMVDKKYKKFPKYVFSNAINCLFYIHLKNYISTTRIYP